MDVDVSPPTIAVSNIDKYDGSNRKKRQWLERHRPINWVPEWYKSHDMSAAVMYDEDGEMIVDEDVHRCIRMRRVNKDLVIPEQVKT